VVSAASTTAAVAATASPAPAAAKSDVVVSQKPFSVSYQWCDADVLAYQTVSGVTYHSKTDGLVNLSDSGLLKHKTDGSIQFVPKQAAPASGTAAGALQSVVLPDKTVIHWLDDGVYVLKANGEQKFYANKKLTPDGVPNLDELINGSAVMDGVVTVPAAVAGTVGAV